MTVKRKFVWNRDRAELSDQKARAADAGRATDARRRYTLGTLEKGLKVLDLLERASGALRIQEIVQTSGMERGGVFRILSTLLEAGYVERMSDKRYRAVFRRKRIRVGFLAPRSLNPFRRDVIRGIKQGAVSASLELVMMDSGEDDPDSYLANVQAFAEAKVDLVIAFLTPDRFAHLLSEQLAAIGLPVIAVETPIPGAVFFGGNNFRAGFLAGNALGAYARDYWKRGFDQLVLVESSSVAAAIQARLSGAVAGVRDVLGEIAEDKIVHLDGLAHHDASRAAVEKLFRSVPTTTHTLIAAFNDPSASGVVEAIRTASRQRFAVVVGQNATTESRVEICRGDSPLIASVAYFPEKYGERVVKLALALLNREQTPLAVYTEHVLLNHQNIAHYYPDEFKLVSETHKSSPGRGLIH